jgi:hypothetical protein
MNFDKFCNSILERVFHGTPHDIVGTFDLNKIGSGEGNMAYGYGAYAAENMEVAEQYRKGLKHRDFINKVREAYDEDYDPQEAEEALMSVGLDDKEMALVKALKKEDWWGFDYPHQAVNAALKEPQHFEHGEETKNAIKNFGNLYEFNILADKENDFLDWDANFNNQPNLVKKVLEMSKNIDPTMTEPYKKMLSIHGKDLADKYIPEIKKRFESLMSTSDSGRSLYKDLSKAFGENPKAASEFLKSIGIKGIKYLDQGSRGVGEGTYNYVIFDPSIIQIVSKNGEFVMQSKTPENVEV